MPYRGSLRNNRAGSLGNRLRNGAAALSAGAALSSDYLGTDLSARAIEQLRATAAGWTFQGWSGPKCAVQRADDFSAIAPGSFDTLVLNSVVQYFPGVDYLLEVLTEAVDRCVPGGSIFIGDVRSLPLLRSYYGSVQWYKVEPEITRTEFSRRIEAQFAREQELAIAPGFFHALMQTPPAFEQCRDPAEAWPHP